MRRFLLTAASLACAFAAAPAQGSVTFGRTQGATDGCSGDLVNVQSTTSGALYASPANGVITSWNYLAGTHTPGLKLRLYEQGASTADWIARAESGQKSPGTGAGDVHASQLNTF